MPRGRDSSNPATVARTFISPEGAAYTSPGQRPGFTGRRFYSATFGLGSHVTGQEERFLGLGGRLASVDVGPPLQGSRVEMDWPA
jgi:hypothetical protein